MIPRTFNRIWLGSPVPEQVEAYGHTWEEHHPGWEMRLWTEDRLPPLRNQWVYDDAEQLTTGNVWQFRSDVARYEILFLFGGVYIDCDFECLRPVDSLIADCDSFAAWEEQDRWIANGLMGCTEYHWFLDKLIEGLPVSVEANKQYRANRSTGPQYLTRMHREHDGLDRVLPQSLIYPYGWRDLEHLGRERPNGFEGAFTVHHWANKRREHRLT